jgi:hypothetical protein
MRNDVNSLIEDMESIDEQINALKLKKEYLSDNLLKLFEQDIQEKLSDKEYGCGTASLDTGDFNMKVVVSKRVKWDQKKLSSIAHSISDHGEDPRDYMNVEYKIPEASYKGWPPKIRGYFEGAREVSQSKPVIKFERKENE